MKNEEVEKMHTENSKKKKRNVTYISIKQQTIWIHNEKTARVQIAQK